MSPRTLLRRFRKSTGKSPSFYIAELQYAKSQWLLRTSRLSPQGDRLRDRVCDGKPVLAGLQAPLRTDARRISRRCAALLASAGAPGGNGQNPDRSGNTRYPRKGPCFFDRISSFRADEPEFARKKGCSRRRTANGEVEMSRRRDVLTAMAVAGATGGRRVQKPGFRAVWRKRGRKPVRRGAHLHRD